MVQLPEEFIQQTQELMGEEHFARYLAAFDEEPPVSIRLNPQKVKCEGWKVKGGVWKVKGGGWKEDSTCDR